MKKYLFVIFIFFSTTFFIFGNNVEVFFAQDDFILIDKFSQNSLLDNVKNLFDFKDVHFRPLHNLFFLVAGSLFGKNYAVYHLFSLIIHSSCGFVIYLIALKIFRKGFTAFVAAIFYLINSSHFVSLYWISGNSVELGFLFFSLSFLFFMNRKFLSAIVVFLLSLLASEAMIFGIFVFPLYELMLERRYRQTKILKKIFLTGLVFAVLRFIFLMPNNIQGSYKIELSLKTFSTFKYYLLRTMGFSETSEDLFVSFLLILLFGIILKRVLDSKIEFHKLCLFLFISLAGLFPFVLMPYHLSPHYMSLSIFGLSLIVAVGFPVKNKFSYFLLACFFAISVTNVSALEKSSWVIVKSGIARAYIGQIENSSAREGSTLVFNDNNISSSFDAYVALGGGKAIDFWFRDKNYKYCFTTFEPCDPLP